MDITVDVSIISTGPPAHADYKPSNATAMNSSGDITVDAGEDATITFNIAPESENQPWTFAWPWITIVPDPGVPPGPVLQSNPQPTAVVIVDNNPNHNPEEHRYHYTLWTTPYGPLDPRIINKPGGGTTYPRRPG